MSLPRHAGDRLVLDLLRALPRAMEVEDAASVLQRAELHGVSGVLIDAWRAEGFSLPHDAELRDAARAIDHAAHLEMLHRLDGALDRDSVDAVALKGALLAERLYARPSSRATTDIDILVAASATKPAVASLRTVGYEPYDGPEEEHFRRAGHHLHLLHASAPQLELHFHAYRGFGTVLRSESLLERSAPMPGFRRIRVLSPADELMYLSVHAAAHRFMRLGWLFDLHLLIQREPTDIVELAFERARAVRMVRPLGFALERLEVLFGDATAAWRRKLPPLRRALLAEITEEPLAPALRSLTRFVYTVALCDDSVATASYIRAAVSDRARRLAIA